MFAAHRHGNGAPDTGLDMNDETFLLVTDINGQRMLIRRENAKNLHPHDIRVHIQEIAPLAMNDNVVTAKDTFLISLG